MSAGISSKYHCGLAQVNTSSVMQGIVGYLLRGNTYTKMDDDTFTPRFGGGAEGLNDLDLWKTYQHTDFSGGSLQTKYSDTTKLSVAKNAVLNPTNELLYPTQTPTSDTVNSGNLSGQPGSVFFKGATYVIANRSGNGGVAKYVGATLTAVKSDFPNNVTSLETVGNGLFAATDSGVFWVTSDGTTWLSQSITPKLIKAFNGKIIATDSDAGTGNTQLWLHDATGNQGAYSKIGEVGDITQDITCLEVFNSRVYIGKPDGLYAYDGVRITTILDYRKDQYQLNFTQMAVQNGFLYFLIRNSVYRYNGATLEKMQNFDGVGDVMCMNSGYSRIWACVRVADDTKISTPNYSYDWYYFDGVGWFRYWSNPNITVSYSASSQFAGIQAVYEPSMNAMLFFHAGDLAAGGHAPYIYRVPMASEFYTGAANDLVVETSEFDAGFPYIDKFCDTTSVTYEGSFSGDTITAMYRIHDGTSWGAWTSTVGGTFRRIQIRVTLHRGSSSSTLALRAFSFRYYLSPNLKRKWTMTFLAQGTSENNLELADGSVETNTPRKLRDQVYACRENDVPSIYVDIDTVLATGTHTSGVTTINLATTDSFPTSGYALNDRTLELFSYSGKTSTTLTGVTRGVFGTTAAAMVANDIIATAYRVVVTKINSERLIAPSIVDGVMDTYGNETELSITMREA